MSYTYRMCNKNPSMVMDPFYRCAFADGHPGACKSEAMLRAEHSANIHPTLDDIRRAIREELHAMKADEKS